MEFTDILPILVPSGIMQILIQAYYIRHCWINADLTSKQKAQYIVAIAIFNLPAAAVYLFTAKKKAAARSFGVIGKDADAGVEIDGRTRQGIFVLLLVAYEIFALRIIAENVQNQSYLLIIGLLGACFVLMVIHGILVRRPENPFYYLLPGFQIALILMVEYLDQGEGLQLIVLVVVAGVINGVSLHPGLLFSLSTLCVYMIIKVMKVLNLYGTINSDEAISGLYVDLLVFILVFATFYTMKKQLLANRRLEIALRTLREQSLQLEEMSAVAERNRIAGEIHDTVGHSLTSAVIAIEAGEKLIDIDRESAFSQLSIAKDQVRQGLFEIRNSVKTISAGRAAPFLPALSRLLQEIHRTTGLRITDIVELRSTLLPIQQNVLLRAVTECATNSLKHGHATEADLLIQEYRDAVQMTFSDNGAGTDEIVFGFGLTTMSSRVESLGGSLQVTSIPGEGCTVSITVPTGVQKEGERI
jgi:signal transduction histidine kinase